MATGNQLRSELERFWPGPIGLFGDLDSPISLAFLESYPSPADARGRWARSALLVFLARQRTAGRQQPAQLLAKLRRAPQGRVGEDRAWTARLAAGAFVWSQTLKMSGRRSTRSSGRSRPSRNPSRRRDLHSRCSRTRAVSSPPPRCWPRWATAATRYPARDALAGDAGQAAVAIESGKRKAACFRWGCNKRLRSSFCRLADSTRHWHPWAQDLYASSPRPRPRPPPRATHPRPRLVSHRVAAAGKTVSRMTPPATAPCNRHVTVTIPTPSGPMPDTSRHPADRSAKSSPKGRPAGPSAPALDDKPTSAIAHEG